jgi:hypothetical protein
MTTSTDNNNVIPPTDDVSAATSSQSSELAAEAENIRRLRREVYCIESTLWAIGKQNRCSKEWIALKSKLDAAQEELDAVLEDHQLLKCISSEGTYDLLSSTLSYDDEHKLHEVSANSPTKPTTVMLSHDLQLLEHQLEHTPKWTLPWFEIKKQIDTETKRCELETLKEEYDNSTPMKPPQKKEDNLIAPADLKIESIDSIFRLMPTGDTESISGPSNNVERTRTTSCSSASHANICTNDSNQLDVSITLISVDGLIARRYEPKSKLPTQWKKNDVSIGDRVTIVASFSQVLSGKEFLTHLPSDPIEVETSVIPTKPFPQQLVEWPDLDEDEVILDDDDNNIELSTYQFSRAFQREKHRDGKSSAMRFIPQTCPINISVFRHGKLLTLGTANLVLTGDERGSSSIAPISMNYRNSKVKNMKRFLKGSKSIPMARIQGDNIQFGFKSDAMLRVLVSVRQGFANTKVPEVIDMKHPAFTQVPCSSGNDNEYEYVEDHLDESCDGADEARVANNINATTENVQLERKIERMKAHIKTLNNNLERNADTTATHKRTLPKGDKVGRKPEISVLDRQRNVRRGEAHANVKLAITQLEQQNKELAERLASISEEKNQLECSLLKEKRKTKLPRREKVASDREIELKDKLATLVGCISSEDVHSNQADRTGRELTTSKPTENVNMSNSDAADERIFRCKDIENSDDGSSNSDDSPATSMLEDVHTRAASSPVTKNHSQLVEVNAVFPMKDQSPIKELVHKSSPGVDNLLSEVCTSLNFDIAELWIHEDNNYHLINSHVRYEALNESMCNHLLEVYHGEGSCERTHRLSLSMCKWAKKTRKILWITEHQTPRLTQALKYSISGVELAVAVPVDLEGVSATVIYFSMTSTIMESFAPDADEYLTKMSAMIVTMANDSSSTT